MHHRGDSPVGLLGGDDELWHRDSPAKQLIELCRCVACVLDIGNRWAEDVPHDAICMHV